ncbi:MAG: hypothetical protein J5859_00125 [Clostridia bacterium]|nr:hypothetical protein [Clostridia bacterium]
MYLVDNKDEFASGSAFYAECAWYLPGEGPIRIHGLVRDREDRYLRLPEETAKAVSEAVTGLNTNTAGGRLRFDTDSPFIVLRGVPLNGCMMDHMPMTGIAGMDVYAGDTYKGTARPGCKVQTVYEGRIELGSGRKTVTVGLPLYDGLAKLVIGLSKGSSLWPAPAYVNEKPVIYYGSSITQGGCASRPGNSYQAFISRRYGLDYRNLGFSGAGRAEDAMIEYLAAQEMCAFVMDYDHNAPNTEHLANTHQKLFTAVRSAHPAIPILLISRPDVDRDPAEAAERFAVIKKTFDEAIAGGDSHVFLINGRDLFDGPFRADCTVDGCHPNDLGFYRMAQVIGPVLGKCVL